MNNPFKTKLRNKKGTKKQTNTSKNLISPGYVLIIVSISLIFLSLIFFASATSALLNPSAVYCRAMGYDYIVEETEDGERGLCQLPDNQVVDAWEFLKGEVAQEYSYCARQAYEIKTIKHCPKCFKFFTDECAVCILKDGSETEVTELMGLSFEETTCGDGTCGIPESFETCPEDCPSGRWDYYCDGLEDGKIDPDCAAGEDPDSVVCIDFDPDTLNISSRGKWVTLYIELPEGHNPGEINTSTILLNGELPPVLDPKYDFVTDEDSYPVDETCKLGVIEKMVKFDRAAVEVLLPLGDQVLILITGELNDGTPFSGTDTIRVKGKGKKK